MATCLNCNTKGAFLKTDRLGLCKNCAPEITSKIKGYNDLFKNFMMEMPSVNNPKVAMESFENIINEAEQLLELEEKNIKIFDGTDAKRELKLLAQAKNKKILEIAKSKSNEVNIKCEILTDKADISILLNEILEDIFILTNLLDERDSKLGQVTSKIKKVEDELVKRLHEYTTAEVKWEPLGQIYRRINKEFNVEANKALAKIDLQKAKDQSRVFESKKALIEEIFRNRVKQAAEYEEKEKTDQAIECYEKIVTDEYWHSQPYLNLAGIYQKMNIPDQELRVLEGLLLHTNNKNKNILARIEELKTPQSVKK
jgi:tetratricopeptide (TPR) repeat protein